MAPIDVGALGPDAESQQWDLVAAHDARRWPLVALAGLIALLVLGAVVRQGSDEERPGPPTGADSAESVDDFLATTSTLSPGESVALVAEPPANVAGGEEEVASGDEIIDAAAEIVGPGIEQPMILIAQQPRFGATRFFASDTSLVTDNLGAEFDDFAVDSGGTWLAAQTFDRRTRERTLWAGPIDGPLRPQAVDIDGFAWHDTFAGQLAFVAPDDGVETLFTLDMEVWSADPVATAEALGPVMSWGGWGVLSTSFVSGGRASLATPNGDVVLLAERGTPAGYVPGLGVVISPAGARDQPLGFDLGTGKATPIEWLSDFQYVWRVVRGGRDGLIAVQASNFEQRRHEVLIVTADGEIVRRYWAVGGSIAMHWASNGSQFMFVRDDGESRTSLLVYDVDGEDAEFDLPGIDPQQFRVRVAVKRP